MPNILIFLPPQSFCYTYVSLFLMQWCSYKYSLTARGILLPSFRVERNQLIVDKLNTRGRSEILTGVLSQQIFRWFLHLTHVGLHVVGADCASLLETKIPTRRVWTNSQVTTTTTPTCHGHGQTQRHTNPNCRWASSTTRKPDHFKVQTTINILF